MNVLQFCALSALLSLLVYYLTTDNICGQPGLQQSRNLGRQLTAASGKQHVLVTGGAGYIGSHAALRLLEDGHTVTVLDNLSRGNKGAVDVLQSLAAPGAFQFVEADLGHGDVVKEVFRRCRFDLVMHFAAVAYVGAPTAATHVQHVVLSLSAACDPGCSGGALVCSMLPRPARIAHVLLHAP